MMVALDEVPPCTVWQALWVGEGEGDATGVDDGLGDSDGVGSAEADALGLGEAGGLAVEELDPHATRRKLTAIRLRSLMSGASPILRAVQSAIRRFGTIPFGPRDQAGAGLALSLSLIHI